MYRCNACGNAVSRGGKYFFIGCWSPTKGSTNIIHFHTSCFVKIAGEEYAEELTRPNKEPPRTSYHSNTDATIEDLPWTYKK